MIDHWWLLVQVPDWLAIGLGAGLLGWVVNRITRRW